MSDWPLFVLLGKYAAELAFSTVFFFLPLGALYLSYREAVTDAQDGIVRPPRCPHCSRDNLM